MLLNCVEATSKLRIIIRTNVTIFSKLPLAVVMSSAMTIQTYVCIRKFSRGTLLATQEPASELLPGGDLFFLPNAAILEDGTINPDSLCVFSGTFRRLSSMVEEEDGGHKQFKLKAVALASLIGCETTSTNLKLVVKGTMKKADDNDETILNLDFSDNFGFTYYTDTKVCSRLYIGRKVDEGESNGQRDLAVNGSDDKHIHEQQFRCTTSCRCSRLSSL